MKLTTVQKEVLELIMKHNDIKSIHKNINLDYNTLTFILQILEDKKLINFGRYILPTIDGVILWIEQTN